MGRVAFLVISALTLFAGGAQAHRRHHHHPHPNQEDDMDALPARHHHAAKKQDAKLEGEAADLKAMMEGVKTKTEQEAGVKRKPEEAKPMDAELPPMPSQDDHAVDQNILQEVAKMREMMGKKPVKKRSSLAHVAKKVDEQTQADRAARYFATHGMGSVGKMLGETLSTKEAQHSADEMKQELLANKKASGAAPFGDSGSASLDDLDISDDEDEAQKKRWAMVDALKHKASFRGA